MHTHVAERINEDTIVTVHKPSVGPFIIPLTHNPVRLHKHNIYKIHQQFPRHAIHLSDHVVAHCCIHTGVSRPLYAPADTAL